MSRIYSKCKWNVDQSNEYNEVGLSLYGASLLLTKSTYYTIIYYTIVL